MEGREVSVVVGLGGIGEPEVFVERILRLPQLEGSRCELLWPQLRFESASAFEQRHRPLFDAGLSSEPYRAAPISEVSHSLVILDLEPFVLPSWRHKEQDRDFFVPECVATRKPAEWKKLSDAWVPVHRSREQIQAEARELVSQLLARDNKVILVEAFEYCEQPLPAQLGSRHDLGRDLGVINLLIRRLSAELGAYVLHAHTGLSNRGAARLGTDFRKTGKEAATILAEELSLTLEGGGLLDAV